jgi:hypothetical protein
MMHNQRCGNGCRNRITGPNYPGGACQLKGVIAKLDPKVREWINSRGCGSYLAPISDVIEGS